MTDQAVNSQTVVAPDPRPSNDRKVRSKADWIKAKTHTVMCPSGVEVDIEIPNLPALIKAGRVPNALLDAAIGAGPDTEVSREMVEQQADFFHYLVSVTVVSPQIEPHEVVELPYEDVEMLVSLALRQRDMDAAYRQIGGLDKVASFRTFRERARRGSSVDDV
jgi:hypothetical protein